MTSRVPREWAASGAGILLQRLMVHALVEDTDGALRKEIVNAVFPEVELDPPDPDYLEGVLGYWAYRAGLPLYDNAPADFVDGWNECKKEMEEDGQADVQ